MKSQVTTFLARRCNATFGYCHKMSVCLSFVMRICCGKTTVAKIMQFPVKSSQRSHLISLTTKFEGDPSVGGSK